MLTCLEVYATLIQIYKNCVGLNPYAAKLHSIIHNSLMVIVNGNGTDDQVQIQNETVFHFMLMHLGKTLIHLFSISYN